jgi:hypothetical protein
MKYKHGEKVTVRNQEYTAFKKDDGSIGLKRYDTSSKMWLNLNFPATGCSSPVAGVTNTLGQLYLARISQATEKTKI